MKTSHRLWKKRKTLQIMYLTKNSYPEYRTQSSRVRKSNFKKRAKDLNRYFTKQHKHVANKHMKTCSTPSVIRELQIKIILRYHDTLNRITSKKNPNQLTITNVVFGENED